jgi:hypothetical protein
MPLMKMRIAKEIGRYGGMSAMSGVPFTGAKLPDLLQALQVFPPIGTLEFQLKCIASLVIIASGIFASVHRIRDDDVSAKFQRGFRLFLIGTGLYVVLTFIYVQPVHNRFDHTFHYVSVGCWRTQLARDTVLLKDASDAKALQIAGDDEEGIEIVWTVWSIRLVRASLFCTYLFALSALNYGLGALKIDTGDAN